MLFYHEGTIIGRYAGGHSTEVLRPRWVNLDNHHVRDRLTGVTIILTVDPDWSLRMKNKHAMSVTDALNRLYPVEDHVRHLSRA